MRLGKFVHNWPRALAAALLAASLGLVTTAVTAAPASAMPTKACGPVTLKWTASEGWGQFHDAAMTLNAFHGDSKHVVSLSWYMERHYRFTGGRAHTHRGHIYTYGRDINSANTAVGDWFTSVKLHATNCR